MSHFTVLVIGANPEQQIMGFHEYECTGRQDQFVQNIDRTDELLKEWKTGTVSLIKPPAGTLITDEKLKNSSVTHAVHGTLLQRYADCFFRDHATEKDFAGKPCREWFLPEGYEAIEVVNEEVMSWRDFVMHEAFDGETIPTMKDKDVLAIENFQYPEDMKWGFAVEDDDGNIVKVYRRTNPNAKWDWYSIGGRWSGMLKLKPGAEGKHGKKSLLDPDQKHKAGRVDQAKIGDIDFEGMRRDLYDEAAVRYDKVMALFAATTGLENYRTWEAILADYVPKNEEGVVDETLVPAKTGGIEAARAEYHNQEFIKTLNEAKKAARKRDEGDWFFLDHDEYIGKTREQYATAQSLKAGITYAIVKDSQWYQRGEMGWFAISSGDVSEEEWAAQFAELVSGLPEDTLLTVIDCHI